MKDMETSEEAQEIYKSMEGRLSQLWEKLTTGNYNMATQLAFDIGFISDIDDCLKKLKIKRTIVTQEGVKEIEMKDIEEAFEDVTKQ